MRFPALLPLLQLLLGGLEPPGGLGLRLLRRGALGVEPRELRADRGELGFVTPDVGGKLAECRLRLCQIGTLALAQLARMLDRLFEARDVRAHLVVVRLYSREAVGAGGVHRTLLLDGGLGGALRGELTLHGELAFAHRGIMHFGAAVEVAQAQRQNLGDEPSLLLLQRLITARGRRLALQVADLFLDLIAHVLQPLEVFARLGDAHLGLLAPLLVTRDAGRLLHEGAHVIGLGIDDARDHALLDDRVAARAEPGAEEQVGDVLAAAAGAVDEVGGSAVPPHLAAQRDLAVARIGAADLAVGVVEDQLDRRAADRLARGRAVEHHIGHAVAAQVLGGELSHHPADRVDDVGFSAAVRPYDTGEIAGEIDVGRIDEGFEAGELDLGQPHLMISSVAPWPIEDGGVV